MSMREELLAKLEAVWDFIENIFSDFFSELGDLIQKSGGELLLATALAAVKAAEESGGSGEDKFKSAYETIVGKLEAEGVTVITTAVKGAIEAAVAKMKAA